MRSEVISEIAMFLDATDYQVALWDRDLVDYFTAHRDKFCRFRHGPQAERHQVWHEGYCRARGLRQDAR